MSKKISIEVIDIVYKLLISGGINLEIFKGNKPASFSGECIVINALPLSNDQLQECIINVNVFVPNLTLKIGTNQDNSQANYERIKVLSLKVSEILNEVDIDDWSLNIDQEYVLENEGFNEHFNNFRISFRNENI
ncbi:hypothetical protein [Pedobacter nototheniae]|uniref:hypothetical protein n=1 Tax=Pedobacter nototheniae TaxID=2488994 RepID=UPI00103D5E40|nr:hypothetical protein [Pedobacter nototheniae]